MVKSNPKPKAKGKKDAAGGAQSHIRARLDYLYNAAIYLQSVANPHHPQPPLVCRQAGQNDEGGDYTAPRIVPHVVTPSSASGLEAAGQDAQATTDHLPQLSRVYMSQMRGVSLKAQLRLPVDVKRSFCKRCDTHLIPGTTCTQEIRNASRGRKKPWADVLVVRCSTCGTEKRFPQTEKRSKRLPERREEALQKEQEKPTAGA
ncbi:Rpr2-domain-containing protein [Aspergillus heteromorphus CBS 117.55]|uniref:Rpr2-domain-containing protein n=1 Tax=Aspergillus heteromorphus CBS 117.55 TaxID=1448321 RepID=A0A317WB97_9EURO|nr:Rpr2-domain-containing protein [Aspergillus heteromorphus CBS 117.55]PWY83469.1 Rpr2-domain-containing protein [Aspergillus heteromorphus CBS 117.55]